MARKAISLVMTVVLMLSSMATAFASESEVPQQDAYVHDDNACSTEPHDHDEVESTAEQSTSDMPERSEDKASSPEDLSEAPAETPSEENNTGYTILETRSGAGFAVFGSEAARPGIVPFIVGSRPCLFDGCPNSVTVTSKYSFVCNTHKCSVAGCPWVYYQTKPKLCQMHAGITSITCQVVEPEKFEGLCGKPSVGNGSPCCWEHHCPGCFGIGNGNATLCDLCRQCWVPGCPNPSTCTNECDLHCPHNCKTHHANHCTDCHADPCVCYPADPTISVKAWNSTENSVAVDIVAARATAIELYTSGDTLFATIDGTSGTYTFCCNAAQNNGNYYVRVKNAKGYNNGSFPFIISVLDVTAPAITGKTLQPGNDVWATSKTLTVAATDQTNITFSLQYADGTAVPNCPDIAGMASGFNFTAIWTLTEQMASAKTFKVIATDKWGYSSETMVMVSGIDGKQPTKPSVLLSDNGDWHKEAVTITFSDSSADSGITYYQYRVDGGEWQTGSTVTVYEEGIHTVEAKAVSGAGLESEIVSTTVKIDLTKPTTSYMLSPEGWTTEGVTITFTPSDTGGSGLASVLLPDGRTIYDFSTIQVLASQNGDYRFTVSDVAGNISLITVPVSNIAVLDVTATLAVPFTISPDNCKLYAGSISFINNSNVPITLTMQKITAYGDAPEFVAPDAKAWESLTTSETKRFLALGFIGNGVDIWVDGQPHSLDVIAKDGTASYTMQGRFGFAWEQAEGFLYSMTVEVAIVG